MRVVSIDKTGSQQILWPCYFILKLNNYLYMNFVCCYMLFEHCTFVSNGFEGFKVRHF
jgi:hypothetical protein